MKIISKHKDYYDGICQSLGIDEHIVYVRENKEIEDQFQYYLPYYENIESNKKYRIFTQYKFTIIGFAGKLYPLLIIIPGLNNDLKTIKYVYDLDKIKEVHNKLWNPKHKWVYINHKWEDYVALLNNKTILNYFHQYKIGSFILGKKDRYQYWTNNPVYILELEPVLNDIEFYKVIDPFTAFTEMSMFISEQLNTEIDSYPMTDIQKVRSKGFDDKYGFRTRPKDKK